MNLSAATLIGLRYSNSRKGNPFIGFINGFSIAGIAIGIMALIITSSVMNGFEGQLKYRILGLNPHFVISDSDPDLPETLPPLLKGSSAFIEAEAVIQTSRSLKPVLIHGVSPADFAQVSPLPEYMTRGELTQLRQGKYNVVVGRTLAINLDLNLGDEIRLLLANKSVYTPFGRLPAQRKFLVSGIFEMGSELDDLVVIANIEDVAALHRSKLDDIASTRLFMNDPFNYLEVRAILDEQSIQYSDWRAQQGALFDAVKMEKNMMNIMLMLIIAVAAFNIVSSLVMVVNEKEADIAILRTQGMTKFDVLKIFFVNGISNGLKGTAIGSVLGVMLATQINTIINALNLPIVNYLPEGELPIAMSSTQISSIILLSLSLCLLAAVYPAWRALKIDPAAALRYE